MNAASPAIQAISGRNTSSTGGSGKIFTRKLPAAEKPDSLSQDSSPETLKAEKSENTAVSTKSESISGAEIAKATDSALKTLLPGSQPSTSETPTSSTPPSVKDLAWEAMNTRTPNGLESGNLSGSNVFAKIQEANFSTKRPDFSSSGGGASPASPEAPPATGSSGSGLGGSSGSGGGSSGGGGSGGFSGGHQGGGSIGGGHSGGGGYTPPTNPGSSLSVAGIMDKIGPYVTSIDFNPHNHAGGDFVFSLKDYASAAFNTGFAQLTQYAKETGYDLHLNKETGRMAMHSKGHDHKAEPLMANADQQSQKNQEQQQAQESARRAAAANRQSNQNTQALA